MGQYLSVVRIKYWWRKERLSIEEQSVQLNDSSSWQLLYSETCVHKLQDCLDWWYTKPLLDRQINCHLLNFSAASISKGFRCHLKLVKSIVWVSNSLDPDETPRFLASRPDISCLHKASWLCLTVLGLMQVKDNAESYSSSFLYYFWPVFNDHQSYLLQPWCFF